MQNPEFLQAAESLGRGLMQQVLLCARCGAACSSCRHWLLVCCTLAAGQLPAAAASGGGIRR